MGALTVAIILADMWFWNSTRVVTHLFLGGITTALFYILCQKGFELVNLGFISLFAFCIIVIPLFKLLSGVSLTSSDTDSSVGCSECGFPASSCPCVAPPPPLPPVPQPKESCHSTA